jgi:hypothetical protein
MSMKDADEVKVPDETFELINIIKTSKSCGGIRTISELVSNAADATMEAQRPGLIKVFVDE